MNSKIKNPLNKSKNPLLTMDDELFKELLAILTSEFDRICQNCPNIHLQDAPLSPDYIPLIKPNLFQQFGQLDILENHPEFFQIFDKIFPFFKKNLIISFSLDFSSYSLYIRNIYNKIFEEVIIYYIFHKSHFPEILLQKINDFRYHFSSMQMNIEIILPIKGIFSNIDLHTTPLNHIFFSNQNQKISLKSFPQFSIFQSSNNSSQERNIDFIFSNVNAQFVKFYISASFDHPFSIIQFDNFGNKIPIAHTFKWNPVWNEIQKVAVAMSLKGFPLKYGRPFFSFPWWISKSTVSKFDFQYPDWIDSRFYFDNYKGKGLIPEIEVVRKENPVSYLYEKRHDEPIKRYLDPDFISSSLNPRFLYTEKLFRDMNSNSSHYLLDLDKINFYYQHLNSINKFLNFKKHEFLLSRFLLLGLRKTLEDIILDTCLILESIFIQQPYELSYRFALYPASLIASDNIEFEKEYKLFKSIYDLRSKIVHGKASWKDKTKNKKRIKNRLLKEFLKNANLSEFETYLQKTDFFSKNYVEDGIRTFLFSKISQILQKLIKKDIQFPKAFENIGFIKIYDMNKSKKLDDQK